ncbi:MAG: hypothetical protein KF723_00145 [Rhizobiaceae bacterium]|nr:hypothetical protein [Rhizobiaceae bacterium]
MRRPLFLAAAAAVGGLLAVQSAHSLPNERWRCKMSGDIPIGTLTVSGSSYEFVVAKNTVWDIKPGDPGNGSGEYAENGNVITPLSGPLLTVYQVVGETTPATDGTPVIFFSGASPFTCWQG